MEAPSVCCKLQSFFIFILIFLITILLYLEQQGSEDRWWNPTLPITPPALAPPPAPSPPTTPAPTHPSRNITILLWHWPFGLTENVKGNLCWDRYHIPGCHLVDQRSLYPSADVVVFHNRELMNGREQLPLHLPRPPLQKWVWLSLESPDNNGHNPYPGVFNWTMSYRRDADITTPYGKLLKRNDGQGNSSTEADAIPKEKSSLACWVVSNYNPQHRRSHVYESLRKTIPVKVYGRGGNRAQLASKDLLPTISHCYFYLAFENSISKDYITEKLWKNAYQAGAVPVVQGPPLDDYKAVAPPDSFIHVGEFASTEALGRYLQELSLDKERYARYFAWTRSYQVQMYGDWSESLCRICPQYHSLPPHKVYQNLEAWANQ